MHHLALCCLTRLINDALKLLQRSGGQVCVPPVVLAGRTAPASLPDAQLACCRTMRVLLFLLLCGIAAEASTHPPIDFNATDAANCTLNATFRDSQESSSSGMGGWDGDDLPQVGSL